MTRGVGELVASVRLEEVTPEGAALLIARDFRPQLSVEEELGRIDRIADSLGRIDQGTSPRVQALALAAHLGERYGFTGNANHYFEPENSYLDQVLARRRGIPVTLSIVYAAVGRRMGLAVELIGFPGHFLARVGGDEGVLIDPFFGGRIVGEAELKGLAARFLGSAERLGPQHVAPCGLQPLVVRMLVNLKHAHERRGDHASALLACDRLFDLTGAADFRRDRGFHALSLGAVEAAMNDLEAYLESERRAPDADVVRRAIAQAREKVGPLS